MLEGGDVCATESPCRLGHPCAFCQGVVGPGGAAGLGTEGRWVCHAALWELDPRGKRDNLGSCMGMAPSIFEEPCEEALAETSPSEALETRMTQTGDI